MSNKSTSTERQLFILSLLSQRKSGYTITEIIDSLKDVYKRQGRRNACVPCDHRKRITPAEKAVPTKGETEWNGGRGSLLLS